MRGRLALMGGVAAIAATASLLGGAFGDPSPTGARPAAPVSIARLQSGFAAGDTVALLRDLERAAVERPSDSNVLTLLGLAYQQRARETGDPAYYPRSERALRRAHALAPTGWMPVHGLAALAASRHRFRKALALAERARRLSPASAAIYGVLGDAALELGLYRRAFAAFDRMAAIRPSAPAFARVSYARELLGDSAGAVDAMQLAVDAAGFRGEPAAWARVRLGDLYFGTGRLGAAAAAYREASVLEPRYAAALAGLAEVKAARSRLRAAISLYERALALSPLPEYAIRLGDLRERLGGASGADVAYARARALEQRFAANGGRNQLETALFDLDHDVNLRRALARAREGHRERPSVEGEHVLAWALYKSGRCREARRHSIRALRLGTNDVDALYHRSLIETCLGDRAASRAFLGRVRSLNPFYLRAAPSSYKLPAT